MELNQERKGDVIILAEAFLWGLFPVVTILTLQNVSSLISLAWSTLFAALLFAIVLTVRRNWKELKNKEAIGDILLTTLIIGVIYYICYFIGLRYTSAGNASLIAQTEIFFSFLFFNVWKKEQLSAMHIYGALLMVLGAVIVLYPNTKEFRIGDLLILGASCIAPLGNFFQRRARTKVPSEAILFIRSLVGAVVIFILAYLTGAGAPSSIPPKTFIFLIINGFFLLGISKLLWIEGIHRISVTKANALNSITPLLTLLFAWLLIGTVPSHLQLLAFIPLALGVVLLSRNGRKKSEEAAV